MKILLAMLSAVVVLPAWGADEALEFHRALYALHEKQLTQHAVRTEESEGDYQGDAAARYRYVDTRYYDAQSGILLSRVRRDADDVEFLHIVEVNVHEQGRLVRDFGSITLPWAPQHPVRTMINLHHYTGNLHSFRQHDVYGDVQYENCEGDLAGKRVNIALDGSDINAQSTAGQAYHACFDGMSKDWQRYVKPH